MFCVFGSCVLSRSTTVFRHDVLSIDVTNFNGCFDWLFGPKSDSDWWMAGIRAEILGSAILIGYRAYTMTRRSSTAFLIGCSFGFGDSYWRMKFSRPGLGPKVSDRFRSVSCTNMTSYNGAS
jgi:hypothetical protein